MLRYISLGHSTVKTAEHFEQSRDVISRLINSKVGKEYLDVLNQKAEKLVIDAKAAKLLFPSAERHTI